MLNELAIIFLEVISIFWIIYVSYLFIALLDRQIINHNTDKDLEIKTTGVKEWKGEEKKKYHRTESTPYLALKSLVDKYSTENKGNLVDFGSGRGRVAIFLHSQLNLNVTGIELSKEVYEEALSNIRSYKNKAVYKSNKRIRILNEEATKYEIGLNDDKFFFFNPFNSSIFEQVIENIKEDAIKNNKSPEVILYYRTKSYKEVLKRHPEFKIKQKIRPKGSLYFREKFIIYKLENWMLL